MDRVSLFSPTQLRHFLVSTLAGVALCSAATIHAASDELIISPDGNATVAAAELNSPSPASPLASASASKVARPSYNTGRGFFVLRGQVYDPNGYVFRIRGVNRNHYDMADQPGISRSGANTVRFFMYNIGVSGAAPASTYEKVALEQHINYREMPIITASNIAGTTTRTSGNQSAANL